jgi:Tfp pilus assembly protein PilX
MMSRVREEQGFALMAAIVLLTVIMGLGLGLLLFTDSQQKASTRQQASEAAFNVAEAALNAQVGILSKKWPRKATEAYPVSCTSTSAESSSLTSVCPYQPNMEAAYKYLKGTATCPGNGAWGSPLSNQWTTYVRDNEKSTLFSPSVKEHERWDAETPKGDGKLWVRATGVVQCHAVTVVTLVDRQSVALNFPENAATGNWFTVTNNGKHTIVERQGAVGQQPGAISMRCAGVPAAECEQYEASKEQVSPALTENPTSPSTTLNAQQLEDLKAEAQANGTYYSATAPYHCPTSIGELSGLPAYIENCGKLAVTSNGTANSSASPGFLILANGTLQLGGSSTFYGVIYAANLNPAPVNSEAIVRLQGGTTVTGEIDVDGNGGIEFGSSGAGGSNASNLTYSNALVPKLETFAGVTPTRNSFRVLPAGQ